MNTWLLTWEGTSCPALEPDQKIIAILSSRRAPAAVADLVDTLYCRSVDSAYDMVLLANKRKVREHQYMHLGSTFNRFFYGRNPCIFARVVSDLKVERNEAQGTEFITWSEPPILQNAPTGSTPVEVEPARKCQLIRRLRPLSYDIHAREV